MTIGRQPTQSTEAEYPPRAAAIATVGQGVSSYGPGRRFSRHPVTYCCRRGTRWADRATTSSASPHSHVHHSSSPSGSRDSDVTQSQAQARQPGGAAIKTHLTQRARRHAGKMPPRTGRHAHSTNYTIGRASAQARRPGKPPSFQRRHSDSEPRYTQVSAGHIQPLKADKHQNPVHGLSN